MEAPLLTRKKIFFLVLTVAGMIIPMNFPIHAEENEETYSISLVQTAEVDSEIHEMEGKRVITESYAVQEGDHVWSILRKRGLLEKRNFQEIISTLKKLNSDLKNIDLIHPGEKILIPLVISPIGLEPSATEKSLTSVVPLETIKDLDLEFYTIKPGDSLIKIIEGLYDIPPKDIHDEYLSLLKKLNPSIRDVNRIYPGQKIRIPIYSPNVVRQPIQAYLPGKTAVSEEKIAALKQLSRQLKELFSLIGEEWVYRGKHFIPLKTGGQISLNADSYPVLDLRNGKRVVVDLYHDLPEKMGHLITSNWDNYRIAHIKTTDTLKTSMEMILPLCDYAKVYAPDEPFILGGDISVRITSDFIIRLLPGESSEADNIIVVNLFDNEKSRTPGSIQSFLEGLGIKIIDYPPAAEPSMPSMEEAEVLKPGGNASSLMDSLLSLLGKTYSRGVEIPVYQNRDADFNLIIKADFLLNMGGRKCIIDLGGMGPEIITLLKEHGFSVLSIVDKTPPSLILTQTLDFLGVEFDSKSHTFQSGEGSESKGIQLMIQGIVFRNHEDQPVFASQSLLSPDINRFLNQKGYRLLRLSPPP